MNAKKISALLLAAVMAIPCAAPSQVLAAEAVVEEAQAAEKMCIRDSIKTVHGMGYLWEERK